MKDPDLVEMIYEALNSRIGSVVETNDPVLLRARLYAAMRSIGEENSLSLHVSRTNPNHLLLLKKGNQDEPGTDPETLA